MVAHLNYTDTIDVFRKTVTLCVIHSLSLQLHYKFKHNTTLPPANSKNINAMPMNIDPYSM